MGRLRIGQAPEFIGLSGGLLRVAQGPELPLGALEVEPDEPPLAYLK